jgi:hypothetical protein
MSSLRALEEWFVHAMTHGDTAIAGAADASARAGLPGLDALLTPSSARSAADRFDVYHHAYRARLRECLADDYPALAAATDFDALCNDYIVAHPSRSFSLNGYGQHMAAFLRERGPAPRAFFAELAALEWALVGAVHAAGGATLGLSAVQAVSPADWEHAVLVPSASLRVLRFEYPVNAFYKHVRDTDVAADVPSAAANDVAICRREMQIWRVDLSASAAHALRALAGGTALLPALTAAGARPEDVSVWFRTWMECGFFASVAVQPRA